MRVDHLWQASKGQMPLGDTEPPDRPARPAKPRLLAPREMPKRRVGGMAGRIALLHSVAHIELNAIDLALDLVARFASELGQEAGAFISDWLKVGAEEAKHFLLLQQCLAGLGATYGDLPAHDGLWEAAQNTRSDLAARLAIVPMVLEARGLDVTPAMIERLRAQGDEAAVAALETIYRDEIGHVAVGTKWFRKLCQSQKIDPVEAFKRLVEQYFKGSLKPPFNDAARSKAGLLPQFYQNSID